ncbi:MAG TPA: amino acid ABC transporter substrate-binding protein [Dongiaceae bacterium]|nr:amino acid ABC transporter substrate-binding protein [Dongiaceae bacterium]
MIRSMLRALYSLLLVAICAGSFFATAQQAAAADTIDTLKQRKVIYLGIRADQPPFSQIGADGVPTGYAIALCGEVVQTLRDSENIPDLTVKYITVSADSRFDDLRTGKVDLLCEGTSVTLQRMQKFDFTLQTWVSGISLMTRSETSIGNIKDLEGRRVGVVGSTTTEGLVRASLQRALVTAEVVTYATHVTAMQALLDKKIDAYFGDRDTLTVLRKQSKDPAKLKIAEEVLSLEPYAMALRAGDDRLRYDANVTLARLYRSGKIQDILRSYFPGAEPGSLLKALFILQAIPEI